MKHTLLLLLLWCTGPLLLCAQTKKPNLQNLSSWEIINRKAEARTEKGKKAVYLNEVPDEGFMILKNYEFSTGSIEFDVKGKNVVLQSFVGIAFHLQDKETFDAIYFRPFNFFNPDTLRRPRSVQYISIPGYTWEKLRAEFPGKYENKVNPVPDPDSWFHAKIVIEEKTITVFVNNSITPSLTVSKLSNSTKGKIALWVGNNSAGSFSNLVLKE